MEGHHESPRKPDENGAAEPHRIACERCRHRKIRCDRLSPCSPCRRSKKSDCTYPVAILTRTKRQRRKVSGLQGGIMEQIVSRLNMLDNHVRTLNQQRHPTTQLEMPRALDPSQIVTPAASLIKTRRAPSPVETRRSVIKSEYEGDSSMSAQVRSAAEYVQEVVEKSSVDLPSLDMNKILEALRDAVESSSTTNADPPGASLSKAAPVVRGTSPCKPTMPPIESAFACIRRANESPAIRFSWLFEFQQVSQFTNYLINVYSPGTVTHADLIIVNAGLLWLYEEYPDDDRTDEIKKDHRVQAKLCRENLETILSTLPFNTPVTLDYVYAFSMAATFRIINGDTSSGWTLICAASRLCQSLGLHSSRAWNKDTRALREQKQALFWAVYCNEKALSLRLGRPSTLRDDCITVPKLVYNHNLDPCSNSIMCLWIEVATIQGRIYDEMYSPAALMQPDEIRRSRGRVLEADMKEFMIEKNRVMGHPELPKLIGVDMHLFWQKIDIIFDLALLTLIYRGIPSDQTHKGRPCPESLSTARAALEQHRESLRLIASKKMERSFMELYLNYALIQVPFIPFCVLFCHTIETRSPADLDYLKTLVEPMQSTSAEFKRTFGRQLRMFEVMYEVARQYIQADSLSPNASQSSVELKSRTEIESSELPPGVGLQSAFMPDAVSTAVPGFVDSAAPSVEGLDGFNMDLDADMAIGPGYMPQLQGSPPMWVDPTDTDPGNWFNAYYQVATLLEQGQGLDPTW